MRRYLLIAPLLEGVFYKLERGSWGAHDGQNIHIWQHRWLPSEGGGRLISPQRDPSLQVVSDLFLPDSTNWNETLIDQHFYPWEASAIKSIPVSPFGAADALIWPMLSDGEYTVKSAYQLLSMFQRQKQASSSDMEVGKSLWNGIWKLRVLNKVRHFLWRAVQNSLPHKTQFV